MEGSTNVCGFKNKAADALIERIIHAQNEKELVTAVHALDRVLLHSYLVIPHWYSSVTRLLHTPLIQIPEVIPLQGMDFMTWWKK